MLSHPEEVPRQLEFDVDEEDVVHGVKVAPRSDLLEARHETVAGRQGVDHRDVIHEPPAAVGAERGGGASNIAGDVSSSASHVGQIDQIDHTI